MDRGTVDIIGDWESQPFTGGYAALAALSDEEFSGAITTGSAWAFILNGRVIGTFDGDLGAFDSNDGTIFEAPHPGLVLLFAMQASDGKTQAEYYTNDTPLTEVDQTLSDSGFTGYIELSENVLSGDYYIVYYGGRSMNVAFVGNARRVLTDEEAFEQARDEVGIYEVRSVELSVQEIPDGSNSVDSEPAQSDESVDEQDSESSEPSVEPEDEATEAPVEEAETPANASQPDSPQGDSTEPSHPPRTVPESAEEQPAQEATQSVSKGQEQREAIQNRQPERPQSRPSDAPDPDRFSEEEAWRKTRTIPALDPEETDPAPSTNPEQPPQPRQDPQNQRTQVAEPAQNSPQADPTPPQPNEGEIDDLKSQIESQKSQISELRDQIETVVDERNALAAEREELEEQLSEPHQATDESPPTNQSVEPTEIDETEALSQTDLFIRYGSKGAATLEDAHDNAADRDAVRSNLRLETHTRFDNDNLVVSGQPFNDFLQSRIEYQFVDWVTDELLYEIRDTGNQGFLKDLYDILPKVDRAELHGTVTSRNEEGDEISRSFDVVLRDRMGQPLLVANVNEARDPAGGDMMSTLAEHATEIAESHDQLGAAFLVTSSFFSPDALETASDATGGGFLSREKRKSYVKLSRKRGFHLCLIEARNDTFHIAVPEL